MFMKRKNTWRLDSKIWNFLALQKCRRTRVYIIKNRRKKDNWKT